MFERENWFAWFPVIIRTIDGSRLAWFETVVRERFVTHRGSGDWRYHAAG